MGSDSSGTMTLELIYLQGDGTGEPAHVQTTVPAGAGAQLVDAVPGLVRKLFGIAEPAATPARAGTPLTSAPLHPSAVFAADGGQRADADSAHASSDAPGVQPLTWVALIAGGAVLGTGVIVGLGAQSSADELDAKPIRTMTDARDAQSKLDGISSRGTIANVMLTAGAAVLALGGVMLYLDLSSDSGSASDEVARSRLELSPLRGGAALTFHSVLDGS
jgi:hypothetical protein